MSRGGMLGALAAGVAGGLAGAALWTAVTGSRPPASELTPTTRPASSAAGERALRADVAGLVARVDALEHRPAAGPIAASPAAGSTDAAALRAAMADLRDRLALLESRTPVGDPTQREGLAAMPTRGLIGRMKSLGYDLAALGEDVSTEALVSSGISADARPGVDAVLAVLGVLLERGERFEHDGPAFALAVGLLVSMHRFRQARVLVDRYGRRFELQDWDLALAKAHIDDAANDADTMLSRLQALAAMRGPRSRPARTRVPGSRSSAIGAGGGTTRCACWKHRSGIAAVLPTRSCRNTQTAPR